MSDIVERLRQDAKAGLDGVGFEALSDLEMEAAAAIEKRDAEIELLREQLSRFERCYVAVDDVLKAKNRDAEIERLRGLLRKALQIDAGDFSVNVDEWIRRVREALGEEK
jgi:hypothetical protein